MDLATPTRRLAVALALSGLLLSLPPVIATARADSVGSAKARVEQLRQLQVDTTRRLLAGTRAWEQDQRALRLTELALRSTRRHVDEAKRTLSTQQAKVAAVARSLYMRPAPAGVQLMLTQSPERAIGAMQALDSLDRVAASQANVIASAATARHRLQVQELRAAELVRRAAELATSSARHMAELQSLAATTAQQLSEAQDALSAARAAAARRAAAERASRLRTSGASCAGRSTAGQSNGNLDPASLCPLWRAPGQSLRYDAAAAFNRMSQFHAATVGSPLCVSDSYRSYQDQVAVYRSKPGLAAVPGTSEHGWGKAVDFCGGVQDSDSSAYQWMKANAGRFGWFHPDWAEPSGSRPEPWHWEFSG
jgi:LAS superfamily LD-carboxypeptidase LdcB